MSQLTCAACAKPLDLERVSAVVCPLCRDPVYCGEACRQLDWVKHGCPNALVASSPNVVPMTEYEWEDEMDPEILKAEIDTDPVHHPLLQGHSVTHYAGDGTVSVKHYPSLIDAIAKDGFKIYTGTTYKRGNRPPLGIKDLTYKIQIDAPGQDSFDIYGSVLTDAIYKENTALRVRRILGLEDDNASRADRGRSGVLRFVQKVSKSSDVLLWPDVQTGENARVVRQNTVPARGQMNITLYLQDPDTVNGWQQVSNIEALYNFSKRYKLAKKTRGFTKWLQFRRGRKFKKDSGQKAFRTYKAEADGSRVLISVERIEGSDRYFIRDLEMSFMPQKVTNQLNTAEDVYSMASETEDSVGSYDYSEARIGVRVDPASLEQMTGLVMALETRAAEGKADPVYASIGNTLRNYVRELNDQRGGRIDEDDIPDQVHTAARLAVASLVH